MNKVVLQEHLKVCVHSQGDNLRVERCRVLYVLGHTLPYQTHRGLITCLRATSQSLAEMTIVVKQETKSILPDSQ